MSFDYNQFITLVDIAHDIDDLYRTADTHLSRAQGLLPGVGAPTGKATTIKTILIGARQELEIMTKAILNNIKDLM